MTIEERKVGTVARMFRDRVFGFIHCPSDERDYFFHQAQLENCTFGQLNEGDTLSFIVGRGPNGKVEAQEIKFLHCGEAPSGKETRAQMGLPVKQPRQSRYRRR
jgi:cold shock CspA family protein